MTWDGDKSRWQKMFKGKWYKVSCAQLGVASTKAASYQAANAWWRTKFAELQAEPSSQPHPHQAVIDHLDQRIDWAQRHGLDRIVEDAEAAKYMVRSADEMSVEDIMPFVQVNTGASVDSWAKLIGEATPQEKTIGGQVERRLAQLKARVQAGSLAPGSYVNTRDCLYSFRDWIGATESPGRITADALEDYHNHLLAKVADRQRDKLGKAGWSRDYALKMFGQAKSFVVYLAGKGLMPLPPNIISKGFKFGPGAKKIVTMTNEEVTTLVDKASGQLRLHLLLMLNCGMTQVDIADLRNEEVDWEAGRIIRKRSKTDDRSTTPTVSYELWSITFGLLKEYRSGKETVLLTKSGGLWAWEELGEDGKLRSSDNIATNYNRLRKHKDVKIDKSLKVFRKTSATRIEGSKLYRHFRTLFLGHAPQGIGEKHYADHSPAYFDEAVAWLGRQYGFVENVTVIAP